MTLELLKEIIIGQVEDAFAETYVCPWHQEYLDQDVLDELVSTLSRTFDNAINTLDNTPTN